MAISRVTQNMLSQRSLEGLQLSLGRLARTREQLTTGRVLNRPSDSPTDTTSAMRMRASLASQAQYTRNAEDGLGWLGHIDSTVTGMLGQVHRARDLALQGANASNADPEVREAIAAEVDQINSTLLAAGNTGYLGRPVFGGVTGGSAAYTPAGAFAGTAGAINRTIGEDVRVQVNVNGPDVFGADGSNVFDNLTALATALRAGDTVGIRAQLDNLDAAQNRMSTVLSDVGTKYARLEGAVQASQDATVKMSASLSQIENTDLPRATVDMQMQEVAYQAALATTARLVQPSLIDFLR